LARCRPLTIPALTVCPIRGRIADGEHEIADLQAIGVTKREFRQSTVTAPPGRDMANSATSPITDKCFGAMVKLVAIVVWRITLGRWGECQDWGIVKPDADLQKRFSKACAEIRQSTFEETLPLWGCPRRSGLYVPVPPDYWANHEIDTFLTLLPSDIAIRTTHALAVGDVPHSLCQEWDRFKTNKERVEKLRPAKGELSL
jgi:hypothetical protein